MTFSKKIFEIVFIENMFSFPYKKLINQSINFHLITGKGVILFENDSNEGQ